MNQNNETKITNSVPANQEPSGAALKSKATAASCEPPIVIAIDHGYGNIKTPTFIFPACVTPCDGEMLLSTDDVLTYEGKRYAIGTGHKEFRQDKIMDEDYYILTLAAILDCIAILEPGFMEKLQVVGNGFSDYIASLL